MNLQVGFKLDVLPGFALNGVLTAGALTVVYQAELARALDHAVESVVLVPTEAQKQNRQAKKTQAAHTCKDPQMVQG